MIPKLAVYRNSGYEIQAPTEAQLAEYIHAADAELGPACADPWVEWCRQALIAAFDAASK